MFYPFCFFTVLATTVLIQPVAAGDNAGTFSVTFGGRVKLDTIYNDESVGGRNTQKSDLAFSPASIPLTNRGKDSIDFMARESRLWMTVHLPVHEQDLSGYVEYDMFDTELDSTGKSRLSNLPRLRHAYATYSSFTIGRTYTTFVNLSAHPEINDANGPLGVLNIRQEILRYTREFSFGELQLALENPDTSLLSFTGRRFFSDTNEVPDLLGKLEFTENWGNWSISGMVRRLQAERIVDTGNDIKWSGAFNIAGRYYLFRQNNLRFSVSYGNALGRYLSSNAFNDATIDASGDINPIEIFSGYLAYQHWWTNELRSSIILGMARANQDTGAVPVTANRQFASSHINLLWSPTLNATIGIEWIHGYRELENGDDGNLNRLQLTAVYKF
ncbi:MAG TPA: DcaP family trimeric outer membrane transporter [Gammaproteobacteria bacterium]|nr:DcaP family trimeric outer membrane transporter [Gammaproteobacteria bacterium]